MKLKTITLIAAIMFAITTIYSIFNFVSLLLLDSEYGTVHALSSVIYILRDLAMCLFFFILYKNQK